MSSTLLPKEQQTPYQRWEMSALPAGNVAQFKKTERASSPKVSEGLAQILENARKEAYDKGLHEGYLAGMEKGREATELSKQRFLILTASLQEALRQAEENIANDMLELALDIAKAMLKTTLLVDSEKVLPIVKEAIRYLPCAQQPARIMLHPEDVKMVRLHLGEALAKDGWHIEEDGLVERGGCLVETASNQIDASNATRWKRINEALGQSGEWNCEERK